MRFAPDETQEKADSWLEMRHIFGAKSAGKFFSASFKIQLQSQAVTGTTTVMMVTHRKCAGTDVQVWAEICIRCLCSRCPSPVATSQPTNQHASFLLNPDSPLNTGVSVKQRLSNTTPNSRRLSCSGWRGQGSGVRGRERRPEADSTLQLVTAALPAYSPTQRRPLQVGGPDQPSTQTRSHRYTLL